MIARPVGADRLRQVPVTSRRHARSGATYSLRRKVAVLVNSVTSFSNRPLVFIFYLGVAIGGLAALAAVYLVIRRVFFGVAPARVAVAHRVRLAPRRADPVCLGIIGIYLSKIFIETKQRPYTIVRSVYERTADPAEPRDPRDGRPLLR